LINPKTQQKLRTTVSQPEIPSTEPAPVRKIAKKKSVAAEVPARQTGSDLSLALTKLLKGQSPDSVQSLVNAIVEVSRSTDPAMLLAMADAKRRYAGMWIGAGLALACLGGGVAILISAVPAVIGIGLLAFGATCAGATFAIATGRSVELREFSASFGSATRTLTGIQRGGNAD
jgi:hypothetical protein